MSTYFVPFLIEIKNPIPENRAYLSMIQVFAVNKTRTYPAPVEYEHDDDHDVKYKFSYNKYAIFLILINVSDSIKYNLLDLTCFLRAHRFGFKYYGSNQFG